MVYLIYFADFFNMPYTAFYKYMPWTSFKEIGKVMILIISSY